MLTIRTPDLGYGMVLFVPWIRDQFFFWIQDPARISESVVIIFLLKKLNSLSNLLKSISVPVQKNLF